MDPETVTGKSAERKRRPESVFDSHCHLTHARFDDDRASVLDNAADAGVTHMVTIASDLKDSKAGVALARARTGLWSTAGVHPHEVSDTPDADLDGIRELATDQAEVVAIGETGLDFFYDHAPRELQRTWFERHLALAHDLGLPVVIHSREAEDDTIDLIRNAPSSLRLVLHCFTASLKLLEAGLAEDCYVSFSGIITFAKYDGADAVRAVPGDRILVETDAPYLTPVPFRGRRNEPSFVGHVIESVARMRGESVAEVARATAANAARFYAIQL